MSSFAVVKRFELVGSFAQKLYFAAVVQGTSGRLEHSDLMARLIVVAYFVDHFALVEDLALVENSGLVQHSVHYLFVDHVAYCSVLVENFDLGVHFGLDLDLNQALPALL